MTRALPGRVCSFALDVGLAFLMIGCGSGGGSSGGPPPPPVAVAVSPGTATVALGGTQQFSATVTGASNTAVTWEVGSVVGGNSTLGTISSTGLYRGPQFMPSLGVATVTAVSQADTTKSASSQITFTSGPLTVIVAPSSAVVPIGCVQQFAATVGGPLNLTGVIWSVNGTNSGNSTVGTISAGGLYAPPSALPAPATVAVAATSGLDPSTSGSASVTVAPASACLASLSPIVAMQNSGELTLTVNGSGFSSASQVMFNGFARPTSFVGSMQLTAMLGSADIAASGTFPVRVQTGASSSNSASFFVVPAIQPQSVAVTAGAESANINIEVPQVFPVSLKFLKVGVENQPVAVGVRIAQGDSANLYIVGEGVQPGTFYVISGNPADITVTQPLAGDFGPTTNGFPAVHVQVSVSTTAALGPRSILITNPTGEISIFPGGLQICNSSGVCQ